MTEQFKLVSQEIITIKQELLAQQGTLQLGKLVERVQVCALSEKPALKPV